MRVIMMRRPARLLLRTCDRLRQFHPEDLLLRLSQQNVSSSTATLKSTMLINKQHARPPLHRPARQAHRRRSQKDRSLMTNSQVSRETGQHLRRMYLARLPCLHSLFSHRIYLLAHHLCLLEKQGRLKRRYQSAIAGRRHQSQDRPRHQLLLQPVPRPRLHRVVLVDSQQRINKRQRQPYLPQQVTTLKRRM